MMVWYHHIWRGLREPEVRLRVRVMATVMAMATMVSDKDGDREFE
jgi:hypothetical protein